ncbi:hypothetical protein Q4561_04310 [Alteromonas sp. 1_MG-2023]|uniref:hypothetical protein n=1 Tax=Alteromonas sp. 1_MG-2023 TaxID=3062669 RepID=UPI0026E4561B|nr:hypothetical protein [Alteromonas sp. 1_MG-2023]MDO6566269.1 hypothetical protein [Alteromonas sp. 1_MG-2023]
MSTVIRKYLVATTSCPISQRSLLDWMKTLEEVAHERFMLAENNATGYLTIVFTWSTGTEDDNQARTFQKYLREIIELIEGMQKADGHNPVSMNFLCSEDNQLVLINPYHHTS